MRLLILLFATYSWSLFGLFGSTAAPLATAGQPLAPQIQEKSFARFADLLKPDKYKHAIQLLEYALEHRLEEEIESEWTKSVIKDAQSAVGLFATRKNLTKDELTLFGLSVQMVVCSRGCLPDYALDAIRANKKCMQFFDKNPQWQKYVELSHGEEMKTASASKRRAKEIIVRQAQPALRGTDQQQKSPVVSARRALVLDDAPETVLVEPLSCVVVSSGADLTSEQDFSAVMSSEVSNQRETEVFVVEQFGTEQSMTEEPASESLDPVSRETESPNVDSSGELDGSYEMVVDPSHQRDVETPVVGLLATALHVTEEPEELEEPESGYIIGDESDNDRLSDQAGMAPEVASSSLEANNLSEADLDELLSVVLEVEKRTDELLGSPLAVAKEESVAEYATMDTEGVIVEIHKAPVPLGPLRESSAPSSEVSVTVPVHVVVVNAPSLVPGPDSAARKPDPALMPEPLKIPDKSADEKKSRLSLPKIGIMTVVVAILGFAGKRYYESRARDSRS